MCSKGATCSAVRKLALEKPRRLPCRFCSVLVTKARGPNPPGSGRRPIRVLVLTPTRELASQIAESFATYGRLIPQHRVDGVALKEIRHTVIFGGVGQRPQSDALRAGVDVVIATPGRFHREK